jgi:hypothetical protein
MADRLSLDELLARQHTSGPAATIEPVQDRDDVVKLTPWILAGGCQCAQSLVIPKKAIESLSLTGEKHSCCGKWLQVVHVTFSGEAKYLADVIDQLGKNAQIASAQRSQHGALPSAVPAMFAGNAPTAIPCGGSYCGPNQMCVPYGGGVICVPVGSTPCGGSWCPPGQRCVAYGGGVICQ